MWVYANPNPEGLSVPDCVIRAMCIALNKPWEEVSDELYSIARSSHTVTCDDHAWGKYLYMHGARPFTLPEACPTCISVKAFSTIFNTGIYIIGTGHHAVCVIDGNYYDTWDSGNEIPTFFWWIAE
ncbi:MAG: hypothetical protein LIR46_03665 [Bacteroidota bacterium]|nr:hypothetical protein [Bacteroidota bacterium]